MKKLVLAPLIITLSACASLSLPKTSIEELKKTDAKAMITAATGCALSDYPKILSSLSSQIVCAREIEAKYAASQYETTKRKIHQNQLFFDQSLIWLAAIGAGASLSDAHSSVLETIGATSVLVGGYRGYAAPALKFVIVRDGSARAMCLATAAGNSILYLKEWESIDPPNGNTGFASLSRVDFELAGVKALDDVRTAARDAYNRLPIALENGLYKVRASVEDGIRSKTGSSQELIDKIEAELTRIEEARKAAQEAKDQAPGGDASMLLRRTDLEDFAINALNGGGSGSDSTSAETAAALVERITFLSEKLVESLTAVNQCVIDL